MLRTSCFKRLQIGAVALLILAFTLSAAGAQPAQAASATQIAAGAGQSSVFIPTNPLRVVVPSF